MTATKEYEETNRKIAEILGVGAEGAAPNYSGDLNLMRMAEKSLNIDQEYLYGEELAGVCRREENEAAGVDPDHEFPFNGWGHFSLATLEASTRAGAFLRLFSKS